MYAGFIVETATTGDLFDAPSHPYTVGPPALDAPRRRPRGRAADPDRGPAAGHAQRADRLPVRPALRVAARRVLDRQPGARAGRRRAPRSSRPGQGATHRIACHNPPTPDEAVARPPGCAPVTCRRRRPAASSTSSRSYAALADGAITASTSRTDDGDPPCRRARPEHEHEHCPSIPTTTRTSMTAAPVPPATATATPGPSGRRRRAAAPGRGPQGLVPDHRGHAPRAPRRRRACRGRGHVRPPPRRDARPRRRVGLRQEHDRAARSSGCTSRPTGRSSSTGTDISTVDGKELQQLRRRFQMIFQDPYASPQPADDRRQHRRRAARRPRRRDQGRAPRARPRAAVDGRAQPRLRRALPARVLGRPAAAHRRRPGARARPGPDRRRRADLRARRVDPGPGHQPPRAAPGPARADLPVHRPRPVGGAPHQRPDRGHVPRPDRRAGTVARAQHAAAPPVLGRAAVGGPDPGPQGRAPPPADHPQGRRAVAGQPAVGLPLPHPLLAARAARQPRACSAEVPAAADAVHGPRGRVPLRRGGRRVARAAPGDRSWRRGRAAGRRVAPRRPCR